jgi:hypothetical protein
MPVIWSKVIFGELTGPDPWVGCHQKNRYIKTMTPKWWKYTGYLVMAEPKAQRHILRVRRTWCWIDNSIPRYFSYPPYICWRRQTRFRLPDMRWWLLRVASQLLLALNGAIEDSGRENWEDALHASCSGKENEEDGQDREAVIVSIS